MLPRRWVIVAKLTQAIWCYALLIMPCLAVSSPGAASAEETSLVVRLVVDSRFIRTSDPVLIKIIIQNESKQDATIILPSRQSCSLTFNLSRRDGREVLTNIQESGDGAELPVKPITIVVAPGKRIVTYDRVFRDTDGDFFFRKPGPYELVAVVQTPDSGQVTSEPFILSVNPRKPAEEIDLIKKEFSLLRQALLPHEVFMNDPGEITALEKIQANLKEGNLRATLDWRLDLLKVKYGSPLERTTAIDQLNMKRGELSEPAQDVLALLLAEVYLEQRELKQVDFELKRLADDSPEKRSVERLLKRAKSEKRE